MTTTTSGSSGQTRKHTTYPSPNLSVGSPSTETKHTTYPATCACVCGGAYYTTLRSTVQKKLTGMQEDWWRDKARELQDAVDRQDMKAFYHNLRAVYGPRDTGSIPVRSSDGTTLITDREGIPVSYTHLTLPTIYSV